CNFQNIIERKKITKSVNWDYEQILLQDFTILKFLEHIHKNEIIINKIRTYAVGLRNQYALNL
ncbi:MAG TPA: hypothetical protein VGK06_11260, partial [Methanosarcina sp.]